MIGKQIKLYDIYNLPHGTQVTIAINKNAFMPAVSFGDKFGLRSGEFKTAKDIEDNGWETFLGWSWNSYFKEMMVDIMYRFEWNFEGINDGKSFEQFVEDMKNEETGVNYEQAARLFYDDENGNCVMIELQVPTKEMIDLTEEEERPWLEGYDVKHLEDYDASKEIYTGIGNGTVITFDNAEELMLALAKELCE